jgi:fucose permease
VATGFGLAAVFPITISLLACFQGMEKRMAGPMFALAGLGGAVMPWLVGVISTLSGSLQTGLLPPLIAAALLLWLHVVGNHGEKSVRQSVDQVDHPSQWREPQVSSRDPL